MKIVSTFVHDGVTFGLDSDGNYWVIKPVLPLSSSHPASQEELTLKSKVSGLLKELEIPQHILGFDYLVTAICLITTDSAYRHSITKMLNPEIAKIHNTTPSRVERAMRHAIEHCDCNELYFDLFGSQVLPTSKQFIITIANQFNN